MSVSCTIEIKNLTEARRDFDQIHKIIDQSLPNTRHYPSFEALAEQAGFNPKYLQQVIRRWTGLSAQEFLQIMTLEHARKMLCGSASLLQMAHDLGVSGPACLHDLIVTCNSINSEQFKRLEPDFSIQFGFHDSPFGLALIMVSDKDICGLGFCNEAAEQDDLLQNMMTRWPKATYTHDQIHTAQHVQHIFASQTTSQTEPIQILLIGTEFETRVWEALLKVPAGRAVTYSDLAEHLGNANAHRAIGSAVGRNPIAFVVPCHRVLRKDATLGGYHWGLTRKQAILCWEAGRLRAEVEMVG